MNRDAEVSAIARADVARRPLSGFLLRRLRPSSVRDAACPPAGRYGQAVSIRPPYVPGRLCVGRPGRAPVPEFGLGSSPLRALLGSRQVSPAGRSGRSLFTLVTGNFGSNRHMGWLWLSLLGNASRLAPNGPRKFKRFFQTEEVKKSL